MDRIEVILATEINKPHSDGQMDIREFNHEITFDHVGLPMPMPKSRRSKH